VQSLLREGSDVAVVDVREPREYGVAHLPRSINVPVGEIQRGSREIPGAGLTVFVCRSGARSLTASALAARAGHRNLAHLEGGLLAWVREVDPSFEVAPIG
jgi:adenylyltransferase/sulfurtransferase